MPEPRTVPVMIDPYARRVADVASALGVDPARGRGEDAAGRLAAVHGPNALEPVRRSTLPVLLLEAATEPFVVLLAIAGLLAIALGEVRDGILVVIALVPIVGADVATEYRGDRALD